MSYLKLLFSRNVRSISKFKESRCLCSSQVGNLGDGAGKGGGGGGSIREAGGAFGRMEAAREEEFFYKQQKKQLSKLKNALQDEIGFHEEQIKRHQEAIDRSRSRIKNINIDHHEH